VVDCERSEHPGDVMFPSNARIGRDLDTKTGLISKNALLVTSLPVYFGKPEALQKRASLRSPCEPHAEEPHFSQADSLGALLVGRGFRSKNLARADQNRNGSNGCGMSFSHYREPQPCSRVTKTASNSGRLELGFRLTRHGMCGRSALRDTSSRSELLRT
jgi:hypothetical protein